MCPGVCGFFLNMWLICLGFSRLQWTLCCDAYREDSEQTANKEALERSSVETVESLQQQLEKEKEEQRRLLQEQLEKEKEEQRRLLQEQLEREKEEQRKLLLEQLEKEKEEQRRKLQEQKEVTASSLKSVTNCILIFV